ncbi:MAG: hypothetical protein QOK49_1799 [Baekduia sp.]|jgi:hypothetical protein|nr:hypothetical protein [Baekduia sp.]
MITALILAADAGRGGQDPGAGTSLLLIAAVVVGVVLMAALLFGLLHKLTRASKGGVEPGAGEFRRGGPPFESFGRRK